jgi:hypothetical protein
MGKKRGERISPFSFGWSTRNGRVHAKRGSTLGRDFFGRSVFEPASAEEADFRIAGNHRAGDERDDDHNNEFHFAPTILLSN